MIKQQNDIITELTYKTEQISIINNNKVNNIIIKSM